ncbi:MAG: cupredoxin domain-containing protein [Actinomycetota bacterium]|nr:cupredoxin domain-containing protein [Actinomycetota bacterium]
MLIAASVAALVLTGCGGTTVRRSIAAATVDGGPWFDPRVITVDKGEEVVLNVDNTTSRLHGFTIEGYGIRQEVRPGFPKELTFVARKGGTFKVYCQLHPDTHKPATLVVQ